MAANNNPNALTFENIGQNVEWAASKDGKALFLRVDLTKDGITSASGKSVVIASTRGNAKLAELGLSLGVNCYKPVGGG